MWKQTAHLHVVVVAILAPVCLCTASDLSVGTAHGVDHLIYVSSEVHRQSLSIPSPDSTLFPAPKVSYRRRLVLPFAGYAAVSALVFLLFSCFMLLRFTRNTNSQGTGRSLAEESPEHFCYETQHALKDPQDKRALDVAQGRLAALALSPEQVQTLKESERELLRDAKVNLTGRMEQLKITASRISTMPSQKTLAERDALRTFLASLEWSPVHDAEVLLKRATAFSVGRRLPYNVACALVVAEQVNSQEKPVPIALTGEQQQLVERFVESVQKEADHVSYGLHKARTPTPAELEAASDILKEVERLILHLHTVALSSLSESLKTSSSQLRVVLSKSGKRKPRKTASLPSVLRMPHREHPSLDRHGPKGALTLRRSFRSPSKQHHEEEGDAEGSGSFIQRLGAQFKSSLLRTSLQRLSGSSGTVSEDSTNQPPTPPEQSMPETADDPQQERQLDAEETSSLTAAMERWTATCRESIDTLKGGAAKESSFDDIAEEGSRLHREATRVTLDPSVDPECSKAFTDARQNLTSMVHDLHSLLVESWLSRVVELRSNLTTARYSLQASVDALTADNPPTAKGPYLGHLTSIKTTADAAKKASAVLSGFLHVEVTHNRLSDAVEGLGTVVTKAEDELRGAVSAAARTWKQALDDDEDRRQARRTVRISVVTSGEVPSVSSEASLVEQAEEALQVLKSFGCESPDVVLLEEYLSEQRHPDPSTGRSWRGLLGQLRTFNVRRSPSFSSTSPSPPKDT